MTDRPKKNASFFFTPVKEGIVLKYTNGDIHCTLAVFSPQFTLEKGQILIGITGQ